MTSKVDEQSVGIDATDTGVDEADDDEVLVEEISIDGMCGVY